MATIDQLKQTVGEILEVPPETLTPEFCFHDLPTFDSMQILNLIVALDDLGVQVPSQQASAIRTFGDVLALAGLK
jgi:acyl carrier protein